MNRSIDTSRTQPVCADDHLTQGQIGVGANKVQAIADKAHLNPTQIYRTLSADGNPALSRFRAILDAKDMRLAVEPKSLSVAH